MRARLLILILLTALPARAAEPAEVMVFGTQHLWQVDPVKAPVAVHAVRDALLRYRPDLVVVEWLHPSVDRTKAFNYAPLGDLKTLGRLWGHADPAPAKISALRAEIASTDTPRAELRVELGKLLYLSGDQLNAAYQWWRAGREGADISELRRLTRDNLAGHEIEVWGFEIAAALNHEYLSPFDYQGEDVGSDVWGDILVRLRSLALARRGVVDEAAAKAFDTARERFEAGESDDWLTQWGDIREVAEYARAWRAFEQFERQRPKPDAQGLAMIRWLQSDAHFALERELNDTGIRRISIGGLGAKRVEGNIHRNRRMAELAAADIRRLGARRVLVIVGATHRYFLKSQFEALGMRWVPSANFVPRP